MVIVSCSTLAFEFIEEQKPENGSQLGHKYSVFIQGLPWLRC